MVTLVQLPILLWVVKHSFANLILKQNSREPFGSFLMKYVHTHTHTHTHRSIKKPGSVGMNVLLIHNGTQQFA
jgi:hypothetical protein